MIPTDVEAIPAITRAEAEMLAATEYGRCVEQLSELEPDDWTRPTDCPLWDVRAMAGHNVGMMSDFTSFRAVVRRMRTATRAAKRNGGPLVDSMTALQVAEHAGLSTTELIARAEKAGPQAARWRTHAPAPLRRMPMKESVGGRPETWRLGYLLDTILTRDPWMHRVDIARATGREVVLTADHDGRIIADVVVEWARRHGRPFTLTLTGPAGGAFTAVGPGDEGEEEVTIDAIEFCRTLSGRATGSGLLTQEVPF
jgi:uncharacterized protein (TIGR03083 family)